MFEITNLAKHSQSPPLAILGQNSLQYEWVQVSKSHPTLIQGHTLTQNLTKGATNPINKSQEKTLGALAHITKTLP